MSSSGSKRRKVTVDIKHTKLERGSVFARLGNKDRQKKKHKLEDEKPHRSRKEQTKRPGSEHDDNKVTFKLSEPKKLGNDKSTKSKEGEYELKFFHCRSLTPELSNHLKYKVHGGVEDIDVFDNLVVERKVSPVPVGPMHEESQEPPKKKSKKHSSKHSSHDYAGSSPEMPGGCKHKERGRSNEKKKFRQSSKKAKEILPSVDQKGLHLEHSSGKVKKYSRQKLPKDLKHAKPKNSKDESGECSPNIVGPTTNDSLHCDQLGHTRQDAFKDSLRESRRKGNETSLKVAQFSHTKAVCRTSIDFKNRENLVESRPHTSRKRSHKVSDPSKKKLKKEESHQEVYSDVSPNSRHSALDQSKVTRSSGGNEEYQSSDAHTEKEGKKRLKSKKKSRKDSDFVSKARYQVIDDDYSDDGRSERKRRKRKRVEQEYSVHDSYHEVPKEPPMNKHSSYIFAPNQVSDHKYSKSRDSLKCRSSVQRLSGVKRCDQHKECGNVDLYKGNYDESKYIPDKCNIGSSQDKVSRHLSSERNSDRKVMEWQRDNARHVTKHSSIPMLMSMRHEQDQHCDSLRSSVNKYSLQRRSDHVYLEQRHGDHSHLDRDALDRNSKRPSKRRLPSLLPPDFTKSRTPTQHSHLRSISCYVEADHRGRKCENTHDREGIVSEVGRNRKHDSRDCGNSRYQSTDTSSAPRYNSDFRNKRNLTDSATSQRSLQHDCHSMVERREQSRSSSRTRYTVKEHRRLKEVVPTKDKFGENLIERARSLDRVRFSKQLNDNATCLSFQSLQDHKQKSLQNQRTLPNNYLGKVSIPSKKASQGSKKPHLEVELHRTGRKAPKSEEKNTIEVNWNELPSTVLKDCSSTSKHGSILSHFSPGQLLQQTGIILSILPDSLVTKLNVISQGSTEHNTKLHDTDRKLRNHLLNSVGTNPSSLSPPNAISERAYTQSMKDIARKMRLVEPV